MMNLDMGKVRMQQDALDDQDDNEAEDGQGDGETRYICGPVNHYPTYTCYMVYL